MAETFSSRVVLGLKLDPKIGSICYLRFHTFPQIATFESAIRRYRYFKRILEPNGGEGEPRRGKRASVSPREAAELTEPQVLLASRSLAFWDLGLAAQDLNGGEGGIRFHDRVPLLPQYFINNIRNYLIAVHPVTPRETQQNRRE